MDHINGVDQLIREGYNGIIICHRAGSLELIDSTDREIHNKLSLWLMNQNTDERTETETKMEDFLFPMVPNIGTSFPWISTSKPPFIFMDPTSYVVKEESMPNIGYLMLTTSLVEIHSGAPRYPQITANPPSGPLNSTTDLKTILGKWGSTYSKLTGTQRHQHQSWKRTFSKDIPRSTLNVLLENLVNTFKNVDCINQEIMNELSLSYKDAGNLTTMEKMVNLFQQSKWTSLTTWFYCIIPAEENVDDIEAIIVGSKYKRDLKIFCPTKVTNKGLARIRYCSEILRESFRRHFKVPHNVKPTPLEIICSNGNRNCKALRTLALIWAYFYNVDIVEVANLGNNDLRTISYFSQPAEDALRYALFNTQ